MELKPTLKRRGAAAISVRGERDGAEIQERVGRVAQAVGQGQGRANAKPAMIAFADEDDNEEDGLLKHIQEEQKHLHRVENIEASASMVPLVQRNLDELGRRRRETQTPADQHWGATQKLQRLEQKHEKMAATAEKAKEAMGAARKALFEAEAPSKVLARETAAMRLEVRKLAIAAAGAKEAIASDMRGGRVWMMLRPWRPLRMKPSAQRAAEVLWRCANYPISRPGKRRGGVDARPPRLLNTFARRLVTLALVLAQASIMLARVTTSRPTQTRPSCNWMRLPQPASGKSTPMIHACCFRPWGSMAHAILLASRKRRRCVLENDGALLRRIGDGVVSASPTRGWRRRRRIGTRL